jgi:hypothetical protein
MDAENIDEVMVRRVDIMRLHIEVDEVEVLIVDEIDVNEC